ncbi:MAG: hypothetical protein ACWGOX_09830 [Desulforhopalus sp.]
MPKLPRIAGTILLLNILCVAAVPPLALAEDYITLTLPQSVITKAAKAILPLKIDAHSKSVEGDITIINISDLNLTDNHLACRLHLAGNNLAFLTEIAGHEIRLKVGTVEIDFKANAAIRFDAQQQTLFIKPQVENIPGTTKGGSGDIGQALIALLNGREFPVTLQKLDPLIARTGAKTIIINSRIADIKAAPQIIRLSLAPQISAK